MIHKKLNLTTLFTLVAFLAVACAAPAAAPTPTTQPPAPIVLKDGSGTTVTLPQPGARIISLAPSNTEILFALGAGSQVVARDSFSDYPAEAASVTDIGGGWGEIDVETILSLTPDLILAADITSPEQVQMLRDLDLTVYVLPNPVTFDELYTNLRTIAQLAGQSTNAETLIAELQSRVAAVETALPAAATHPVVFYELDATQANAPWTAGPGTFVDTLITSAGGTNLGGSLDGAWVQISLETLVAEDPPVIILGDATWGGVTPADLANRSGWENLSAVTNGQVFPFDDNLVSRPGPRMVDGLEQMARLLHPELFD